MLLHMTTSVISEKNSPLLLSRHCSGPSAQKQPPQCLGVAFGCRCTCAGIQYGISSCVPASNMVPAHACQNPIWQCLYPKCSQIAAPVSLTGGLLTHNFPGGAPCQVKKWTLRDWSMPKKGPYGIGLCQKRTLRDWSMHTKMDPTGLVN